MRVVFCSDYYCNSHYSNPSFDIATIEKCLLIHSTIKLEACDVVKQEYNSTCSDIFERGLSWIKTRPPPRYMPTWYVFLGYGKVSRLSDAPIVEMMLLKKSTDLCSSVSYVITKSSPVTFRDTKQEKMKAVKRLSASLKILFAETYKLNYNHEEPVVPEES
jgi:hypothetical protein